MTALMNALWERDADSGSACSRLAAPTLGPEAFEGLRYVGTTTTKMSPNHLRTFSLLENLPDLRKTLLFLERFVRSVTSSQGIAPPSRRTRLLLTSALSP